jgi:hypothetical protein
MKLIVLINIVFLLIVGCARNLGPASGTAAKGVPTAKVESLGKKEDSIQSAKNKASEYCRSKGYSGYEQLDIFTSANVWDGRCKTVKVNCPVAKKGEKKGADRGTCLEYQCAKKATEWTTKMLFQCR